MTPRHVLAINTDQLALLVVNDILEEAGYFVSLLSYRDHDLDEIKRLAPDVIVLDYQWPGDDNGWSLLQLLRLDPRTATIPILLCTGAAREAGSLREHLGRVGIQVVLKPYLAETLLSAIADISNAPTLISPEGLASPTGD
jgi:CheY-like chemotaxis protein